MSEVSVSLKGLISWSIVGLITGLFATNVIYLTTGEPHTEIVVSGMITGWIVVMLYKIKEYRTEYVFGAVILLTLLGFSSFMALNFETLSVSILNMVFVGTIIGIMLSVSAILMKPLEFDEN